MHNTVIVIVTKLYVNLVNTEIVMNTWHYFMFIKKTPSIGLTNLEYLIPPKIFKTKLILLCSI